MSTLIFYILQKLTGPSANFLNPIIHLLPMVSLCIKFGSFIIFMLGKNPGVSEKKNLIPPGVFGFMGFLEVYGVSGFSFFYRFFSGFYEIFYIQFFFLYILSI